MKGFIEGKPLSESNNIVPEQQILENNINIKVNITVNPQIRASKRPGNSPAPSQIPQKVKTVISKPVLGENGEKGSKGTAEKQRKPVKSLAKTVHKNNFQGKREGLAGKEGSKEEGINGDLIRKLIGKYWGTIELNSQVQKLMDNLIKLKNDTNKLYSSYRNNSENKRTVQTQSPFEKYFLMI